MLILINKWKSTCIAKSREGSLTVQLDPFMFIYDISL